MSCTALCSFVVRGNWPSQFLAPPSPRLFELDFSDLQALQPGAWAAVMAYVLVMVFDIGGAIYGKTRLPYTKRDTFFLERCLRGARGRRDAARCPLSLRTGEPRGPVRRRQRPPQGLGRGLLLRQPRVSAGRRDGHHAADPDGRERGRGQGGRADRPGASDGRAVLRRLAVPSAACAGVIFMPMSPFLVYAHLDQSW